jgi:hypothetical protein
VRLRLAAIHPVAALGMAFLASMCSRRLSPTELAVRSQGGLGTYLAGAETWRHAPVASALARNLPGLAELACSTAPGAISVELTLERRKTLDAPIETNRVWTRCR